MWYMIDWGGHCHPNLNSDCHRRLNRHHRNAERVSSGISSSGHTQWNTTPRPPFPGKQNITNYVTATYTNSGVILGYLIFSNALYINNLTFITRPLSSPFVPNVTRQELKVSRMAISILTLNVRKTRKYLREAWKAPWWFPNVKRQELNVHQRSIFLPTLYVRERG